MKLQKNNLPIGDLKKIHLCECTHSKNRTELILKKIEAANEFDDISDVDALFQSKDIGLISESLYHYTGAEALLNILKSSRDEKHKMKNSITMRFSRVDYMNDIYDGASIFNSIYQEFIKNKPKDISDNFLQSVTEIVNKLHDNPFSDSRNVSYVCSLTLDGDSLPMWRNYTSAGGGYNIKFNPKALYEYCESDFGWMNIFLIPVVYDCDVMQTILNSFLHKLSGFWISDSEYKRHIEATLHNFIVFSKLSFKHPSFSHEREVRLVKLEKRMYDTDLGKSVNPNENYITANGILRPYINVEIPSNAFIGVTVGPLLETEVAKRTIENVIGRYVEWSHSCPVETSIAPIRF